MGSKARVLEEASVDEAAEIPEDDDEGEEEQDGAYPPESAEPNFAEILGPDCVIRRVDKDKKVLGTAQPQEMQQEVMQRAAAQKRLGAVAEHVKTMTRSQKLDWAIDLKRKANEEYSACHFEDAAKLYNDCLCALDLDGTDQERREVEVRLQLPACTNLAACMIEMGQYESCIEICEIALAVDGGCAKALYRRGLAYYRLGNYMKARPDFEQALQAVSADAEHVGDSEEARSNGDLHRRIVVYLGHIRSFYRGEKDRCRQMFQDKKGLYEDTPATQSKSLIDDSDEAIEAALSRIRGDWRCCCRRRVSSKTKSE
mmetsp:Transcript_31050/g.68651  ORF Transcript_31050/g.68651 Transcript_31050/m.68651 type:complete len:314 (+) Transcript_31050:46-987(+)